MKQTDFTVGTSTNEFLTINGPDGIPVVWVPMMRGEPVDSTILSKLIDVLNSNNEISDVVKGNK